MEDRPIQANSAAAVAQTSYNDQSRATGNRNSINNGSAQVDKQPAGTNISDSFNTLLNSLQNGQNVVRNTLANIQSEYGSVNQLNDTVGQNILGVSQTLNQRCH